MSTETRLPKSAALHGCLYNISEREGTIIFAEAYPVWSQQSIMRFWREDDSPAWYMSLHGDRARVSANHVTAAYAMVVGAYGDGYGRTEITFR